jgi:hypothetical protein
MVDVGGKDSTKLIELERELLREIRELDSLLSLLTEAICFLSVCV